jgi:hypothetical protein
VLCYTCRMHAFSEEVAAAEGGCKDLRFRLTRRGRETYDDSTRRLLFSLFEGRAGS